MKWKCSKCGYLLDGETPPEKWPGWLEKCAFADVTCYTPECGGKGNIDTRTA